MACHLRCLLCRENGDFHRCGFDIKDKKIMSVIADIVKIKYNIFVTAPRLVQKGGVCMEVLVTFLVAVAAGVACHYIIKWLDSNNK